jgi:TM2 domain-containing membrane protein YozV
MAEPPPPGLEQRRRHQLAVTANLVIPGMGQFLQRRWLAGLLFMALAFACFGLAIVAFVMLMRQYVWVVQEYLEGRDVAVLPSPWPALATMGGSIALLAGCYLWSLYDAHRGATRAGKAPDGPSA